MNNNPIGIFDSGLGGLTVTKAITKILPNESFIYLGDTAHTPWGDKSTAAIKFYSDKICSSLIDKLNCKIIVVACNTASAVALDLIKEKTKDKAIVINVIDPIVEFVTKKFSEGNIGLIGTKQTIRSNTYQNKIKIKNPNLNIKALTTPLLVPLIEEGFVHKEAAKLILKDYLNSKELEGISSLILGCTHYPIIKEIIENFYENKIDIIDSAELTAKTVKNILKRNNLLSANNVPAKKFFVTDYNEFFKTTANTFLAEEITLEHLPLWD